MEQQFCCSYGFVSQIPFFNIETFKSILSITQYKENIDMFLYGGGDGSGATQPLQRDRGAEELHGDLTVWPHHKVWRRCQK